MTKIEDKDILKSIIHVITDHLPLISKQDLGQLMVHYGYTTEQFDSAIKCLKGKNLIRVGLRNTCAISSVIAKLPIGELTEEFIQCVAETSRTSDQSGALATQLVSATPRLAGLAGRDAVGNLDCDLLHCYLRLSKALITMRTHGISGLNTWETHWPKRSSTSRIACARFKPFNFEFVRVTAPSPMNFQEAERWLQSLKRSGRKYVIC